MKQPSDPTTPSLARVYADQGHLQKAALIYQRLMEAAPECREYASALETIENQLSREPGTEEEAALAERLCTWIELVMGLAGIEQLRTIHSARKA